MILFFFFSFFFVSVSFLLRRDPVFLKRVFSASQNQGATPYKGKELPEPASKHSTFLYQPCSLRPPLPPKHVPPATERTALASRPNLPVEAMTIWGRPGKCIKTEWSPVVYCIVHRIGLHKSMQPTIRKFLLYNSNCEKNIRILIHRIWALTQWQKNGTAVLPSNWAK